MDTPDSFTGPVNLGNPVEITIKTLAEMIIKMTGSKSKIVYLPLPQDDPKQRKPDITLAIKELKLVSESRCRNRAGEDGGVFQENFEVSD